MCAVWGGRIGFGMGFDSELLELEGDKRGREGVSISCWDERG